MRSCKCSGWKENFPSINAPFLEPHSNYAPYEGLPFNFCPWCSKRLFINDQRPENLRTANTCINGKFHIRLFDDQTIVDEMVCELKRDISYCCATMLRWYDKNGGISKMADAARDRLNKKEFYVPRGRVWTKVQWDKRGQK